MSRRALTESEKASLERSAYLWLIECQRLANEFDALVPDKSKDLPSDTDAFIITATYFIMAAGCTYLHCQSLLEAKLGTREKANKWLRSRCSNFASLQTLVDRRDWLNHGAIYRSPDFKLTFSIHKGPDKTIDEVLTELERVKKVNIKETVRLRWTDGYGKPTDNVSLWHKEVISQLKSIIEDVKQIS